MDEVNKQPALDWRIGRAVALHLAVSQNDLQALRKWSTEPGGFGTDQVRQKVWPYLLHVDPQDQAGHGAEDERETVDSSIQQVQETTLNPSKDDMHELEPSSVPPPNVTGEKVERAAEDTANMDEPHKEERQVLLDTNRSFVHYPTRLGSTERSRLQEELFKLIVSVLRTYRGLCYFQGYHDILSVIYLTFFPYQPPTRSSRTGSALTSPMASRPSSRNRDRSRNDSRSSSISRSRDAFQGHFKSDTASNASRRGSHFTDTPNPFIGESELRERSRSSSVNRARQEELPYRDDGAQWKRLVDCCSALTLLRIRDGMGGSLDPVVGYLRLTKRILRAVDGQVASIVTKVSPTPYFALSWILTSFSHDCDSFLPVQRIFDYLLCRNPALVIYLGVAMVMVKKDRLIDLKHTLEEDPGVLHSVLARLPPLIADEPEGSIRPPQEVGPLKRSDSYVSPDSPEPLEPVVLSELFKMTDALWERFPLDHPAIRAEEIMGRDSVIYTYKDDHSVNQDQHVLEEAAEFVKDGIDESKIVVTPPPPAYSDDEDIEPKPRRDMDRKRSRTHKTHHHPNAIILGRVTVASSVIALVVAVLIYQGRWPRTGPLAAPVASLWYWKRTIEMHIAWQRLRWGHMDTLNGSVETIKAVVYRTLGW